MSLTQFKLSKQGGLTRRFTFPERPSWFALASKIEALYHIPIDKVGVAYVDSDGDEVTLSSEEELAEFYKVSHHPPQPIKFAVQDLRTLRESFDPSSKALPDTPRTSGNLRNTFGGAFDIEDDWQIPGLSGLFRASDIIRPDSPHAYLEVIESDAARTDKRSSIASNLVDIVGGDVRVNSQPTSKVYEPSLSDTISSTGSVLAEDAPPKHPLHVYDLSFHEGNSVETRSPIVVQGSNPSPGITPTAKTPETVTQPLKATEVEPAADDTPDPPLPEIPVQSPNSNASLSHDIATLLDTFTNVLSAHPELPGALRNIVQNATTGTYWQSHRDALSRGAEELVRTAQEETGKAAEDFRRIAEEEAGRRVTEAIGGILRMFSDVTGNAAEPAPTVAPAATTSEPVPPTAPAENAPQTPNPPVPPPPMPTYNSSWYRPNYRPVPFHPPPPPPLLPQHIFDCFGPPYHHPGHWGMPPPPPPPPPAGLGPQPEPPLFQTDGEPKPTPEEIKAEVDAAKMKYKAEKERYRAQRGERRKEKQRKHYSTAGESNGEDDDKDVKNSDGKLPDTPTQIISNARGSYPQLEMFSVQPRRGPSIRRHGTFRPVDDNGEARVIQRITRRLADMGFLESAYPTLPTKIKSLLPASGKDGEDDIVTTLLEDLLAMSPKAPVASGSNLRKDREIPGAWR